MFKSIVIAYDGSAHAARALETAAGLAREMRASLGIICVVDPGHVNLPSELQRMAESEHIIDPKPRLRTDLNRAPGNLASEIARSAAEAQQATLQFAEFLVKDAARQAQGEGVASVDTATQTGEPAATIVEYAADRDADLIVCGSRGLGRVRQLLLGSTSHKIAQLAHCSCLTVR